MKSNGFVSLLLLTLCLSVSPAIAQGSGQGDYQVGDRLATSAGAEAGEFREIVWDDLIPPDWAPEDLFEELFADTDMDRLDDADPRAMELMQKVREAWDNAPLVSGMNGQRVRIPGFVVPLEGDDSHIRDFLLVPYFGACIHVPPPPANQLIHVEPDEPISAAWNMVPVWVSGVLSVDRSESDLGTAGYRLRGMKIVEYE